MKYIAITNQPHNAKKYVDCGVDWVMVDLEKIGKQTRQKDLNTLISNHTISDVVKVREQIEDKNLLVRINPLGEWTKKEIDDVISAGAGMVMLPFFKTVSEVKKFIELLRGRAKAFLLLETMEGVKNASAIASLQGIDFIHVGLNDLHIERKTRFMFEFLSDGYLDDLAKIFKFHGISYGFGGISRVGNLKPPAERLIAEHIRLGSDAVILSRSFINQDKYTSDKIFFADFKLEFMKLKHTEMAILNWSRETFIFNKNIVFKQIQEVADVSGEKN
jgi:hypothetical protein